jgi:hypothetical protein
LPANCPGESAHYLATAAIFTANLLLAAGDGEAVVICSIAVWRASKETHQIANAAEIWATLVNIAAAGAGVEVDAPPIWAHHREVKLPLRLA